MTGADELGRLVGHTGRVVWVWAALDAGTRQVVAVVTGDRSEATAARLWAAPPAAYRDGAAVCTDFRRAYPAVVPADRHAAAGKDEGRDEPRRAVLADPAAAVRPVRPQDVVVLEVPAEPRRCTLVLHPLVQSERRVPAIEPLTPLGLFVPLQQAGAFVGQLLGRRRGLGHRLAPGAGLQG